VFANGQEARTLTGSEGADAAQRLGERYRLAAVKLGDRGAMLVVDGVRYDSETTPITELDPTGAGDAFDGVVLASLARGADPAEALALGCRAGAMVAASLDAWPAGDA
jgi:sugar/nucleoside kinase (ribokinase family)